MSTESGDSDELEALFDSIVQARFDKPAATEAAVGVAGAVATETQAESIASTTLYNKIGHLTRVLHDTLRELGYDKALGDAAGKILDARGRLNYIATLTEQAAVRVLDAVEASRPLQERLAQEASQLATRWQDLFERKLDLEQFKMLVHETRQYLNDVPSLTKNTSTQLMNIVMAQDYQDLTGQVLKKLSETVQETENQLLALLIESLPASRKKEVESTLLEGPLINPEGRSHVVTSQAQVDDLLESLGF